MGKNMQFVFLSIFLFTSGLNEIVHPEKSPHRKKRHDFLSYEQEIRNKLISISPFRSTSMTPNSASPSSIPPKSPSGSQHSDHSNASASRPPLSAITPTKTNLTEKIKPRPLNKRTGFKRAMMQKFKITKTNR